MKKLTSFVLLLSLAAFVYADNGFLDTVSPFFLSQGASVTTLESPSGIVANPASSADKQRITLDLSYLSLLGLSTASGVGHAANLGMVLPTRFGVFSGTGRFATTPFTSTAPLNWGTLGELDIAFSKDLFPEFYLGFGVHGIFGGEGTYTDWGLGADLGFLYFMGDLGIFKDFRLGFAMRNMGKGYLMPAASTFSLSPVFTPALGASFSPVKTDVLTLTASPDFSFPTFQNVLFTLPLQLSIADIFFLDVAYRFDLREVLGLDAARTVPVSFGLSFKLKTDIPGDTGFLAERGWNRNEVRPVVSAAPLANGVLGLGFGVNVPLGVIDRTPPRITVETEGEKYISPNFDGVQDDLVLPIRITDERVVNGYVFVVQDAAGTAVRTIQNKDERPRNLDWAGLAAAFLYEKKGIPIPETLRWDGKSDAGAIAADGAYRYYIEAWDDNGNRGKSALGTVVVDTVPPTVGVNAPYLIFSPNGDGNKDVAVLEQTGSAEDLWAGTVQNIAGEKIASFRWEKSEPKNFEWSGKNDEGVLVPDGVYSYRVTATDRAGNVGSFQVDNLIKNNLETPIRLSVDLSYFSPNGDGIKDAVAFSLDVPVVLGIESWTLAIQDRTGAARRTMSGRGSITQTLSWDGRGDDGAILPEGAYKAVLTIVYVNGNHPSVESPAIVLDLTPPTATVKADPALFSPDGDGLKDSTTLTQKTSDEVFWTGTLTGSGEREVKNWIWRGKVDPIALWDGRGDDGNPVLDGTYAYVISATDRAGNAGASTPLTITVDTRATPLKIATDIPSFSPNGDGVNDTIRIVPTLGLSEGIESFTFRIRGTGGDVVRTVSGRDKAPDALVWDGKDDAGRTAIDGPYYAEILVVYAKGNQPKANSNVFTIDTAKPTVSVRTDFPLFSPNGDGNLDTTTIYQSSSEEDRWVGQILDASGNRIHSYEWKGKAGDVVWDGRGDDGRLVQDGTYVYLVRATDKAGNSGESTPLQISTDTRATPVRLSSDRTWFSPNGDKVNDTVKIIPSLKETEGVSTYTIWIKSASGEQVRTITGKGVPTDTPWDGRNEAGRQAPDGQYGAELEVVYAAGNKPRAASNPFSIDTVAPSVTARADINLFSPDGDDRLDVVKISQSSSEEDLWEAEIRNAAGQKVRGLFWQGRTAEEYVWDGRSDEGTQVPDGAYTYQVRATDKAGNLGQSAPITVTLDTRPTPVRVTTDLAFFSPNRDGVKDTVKIVPVLGIATGIESFTWRIRPAGGGTVKTVAGSGRAPAEFSWDGRDNAGNAVPDGAYTAELELTYAKGNQPKAASSPFVIDTVSPSVTLSPDVTLFSPDGDNRLDIVTIAQTTSEEDLWEAEMRSARGEKLRSWYWKGSAQNLLWDGKDENGNVLPDGAYSYSISATDKAGNATSRGVPAITIDTRATSVFVTAGSDGFSPNGDGQRDTLDFSLYVTLTDGIKEWKLSMVNSGMGVQKTFSGEGASLPKSVTWDGTADGGGGAAEGSYAAVLQVEYFKGSLPEARTSPFLLSVSAPKAEIALSPTPFSPDNDGVDDELSISLKLSGVSAVESWDLTVLDPMGHLFSKFSGKGTPAEKIIWDGMSDKGELVQAAEDYPIVFTVKDALGNSAVTKSVIAVDVLVLRDGNKLKVRISSITFAPYTADYSNVEAEKADKNSKTIKRLAEIFKKYSRYKIRIEGHAASEYWANPQRAAIEQEQELIPLSKKRAESIKAALVKEGIDAARISTEGIGGAQPVVPHGDMENLWKNRRVEFILVKE